MNSLDDLRTNLGREADSLDDRGAAARLGEVRGRIRTVRRRRAASVAAAAAVVLVGAGVTVAGLHSASPDLQTADGPHQVAGRSAPDQVTITGYSYAFDQALEPTASRTAEDGSRVVRFTMPARGSAGDRVAAVSLATGDLGGGAATLSTVASTTRRSLRPGAPAAWSPRCGSTPAADRQADGRLGRSGSGAGGLRPHRGAARRGPPGRRGVPRPGRGRPTAPAGFDKADGAPIAVDFTPRRSG